MPQMGYGVYQVSPEECERCVSDALEVGYRMIDTAQAYHNEEGVGNAWRESGIRREDLFLVSKIWISNYGYEKICEPLLERIDFRGGLDLWVEQVTVGGESGRDARVCDYDWVL